MLRKEVGQTAPGLWPCLCERSHTLIISPGKNAGEGSHRKALKNSFACAGLEAWDSGLEWDTGRLGLPMWDNDPLSIYSVGERLGA